MEKGKYLDSWKDIAAYLGRSVRACRTWERELGLPVHRLDGSKKARVFAYTGELDRWRAEKGQLRDNGAAGSADPDPTDAPRASGMVAVRRSVRTWVIVALVAVPLFAAAAAALITRYLRPPSLSTVGRFSLNLEPGYWLDGVNRDITTLRPSRTALVISRDGTFVVYSAVEENPGPQAKPRLFLRRIGRSEAQPIDGAEGGVNPFLSPDDRQVGFWTDGKLKTVPIEGGVPTSLCDLSGWLFGASWGADDSIVFADGSSGGLSRVSSQSGKPEILTEPDPGREEYAHRLPSWLPNGKALLFTTIKHQFDSKPSVSLLRLDTREWHVLLEDASDARYVPTGHLVFLRRGTLMAVRFNPTRLEVIGQPVELVETVMQAFSTEAFHNTGAGQFSISDTGSLVYVRGEEPGFGSRSLVWVDQSGEEELVADFNFPIFAPRLSPDGRRVASSSQGPDAKVWIYDLEADTSTPLTSEGNTCFVAWAPGGRRVLFDWQKSRIPNLYWQSFDESSPMERLTTNEHDQYPGSWSPDGKTVAVAEFPSDTNCDISLLDTQTRRVTAFLNSAYDELYPEFSPDGRWIAYQSNESGQYEVYVRAFPGPGPRQQISRGGAAEPIWARDGRQLFYRRGSQMWVVDVRTDGGLSAGKPRLLFERSGYAHGRPIRAYDLSLDGKRFLMVKPAQTKPSPVIDMIYIQNWFDEL